MFEWFFFLPSWWFSVGSWKIIPANKSLDPGIFPARFFRSKTPLDRRSLSHQMIPYFYVFLWKKNAAIDWIFSFTISQRDLQCHRLGDLETRRGACAQHSRPGVIGWISAWLCDAWGTMANGRTVHVLICFDTEIVACSSL